MGSLCLISACLSQSHTATRYSRRLAWGLLRPQSPLRCWSSLGPWTRPGEGCIHVNLSRTCAGQQQVGGTVKHPRRRTVRGLASIVARSSSIRRKRDTVGMGTLLGWGPLPYCTECARLGTIQPCSRRLQNEAGQASDPLRLFRGRLLLSGLLVADSWAFSVWVDLVRRCWRPRATVQPERKEAHLPAFWAAQRELKILRPCLDARLHTRFPPAARLHNLN